MGTRVAATARQQAVLAELGIEVWRRHDAGPLPAAGAGAAMPGPVAADAPPAAGAQSAPAWETLRATVRDCRRCALHEGRTQTVFGVGSETAAWMIIGEAPGVEEDRRGEPFVGRAGQLLDEMLRAVGVERRQVYIANILKCHPPGNRDPRPEEVAACADHLAAQLRLVSPRLILAVGRIAAQTLLGVATPLGRLRGQAHAGPQGIPLVVTYHPAYLLRKPEDKAKAWVDLQLAMRSSVPDPA